MIRCTAKQNTDGSYTMTLPGGKRMHCATLSRVQYNCKMISSDYGQVVRCRFTAASGRKWEDSYLPQDCPTCH